MANDNAVLRGFTAAVTALVVGAATACTGTGADGGADRAIHLVTGMDVSGNDLYLRLIQEWNEMQGPGGYQAYLVEIPGSADEGYAEMLRAAQTGRSEYDIFNIDNQFAAAFAAEGRIEEFDSLWNEYGTSPSEGGVMLDEVFQKNPLESVKYDQKVYAVPFITDVGMFYYRTDLLDAETARAGENLTGLLAEMAEPARDAGIDHLYISQFDSYEGFTVNTMEIINGEGGALVKLDQGRGDGSGLRTADIHENNVEYRALQLIADRFADGTLHPASLESGEEESYVRFLNSEAAAMRNWPTWYPRLLITETETGSGQTPEFSVKTLPGALLGGQSLALSSDTRHEEKAVELIRFLTGKKQQQLLYYCGGYAPTRHDVYRERLSPEEAETLCADYDITGQGRWHAEASEFLVTIRIAVEDAQVRPLTPYYSQFSEEIYTRLHPLLVAAQRDETSLDPVVLNEIRSEADAALRGR